MLIKDFKTDDYNAIMYAIAATARMKAKAADYIKSAWIVEYENGCVCLELDLVEVEGYRWSNHNVELFHKGGNATFEGVMGDIIDTIEIVNMEMQAAAERKLNA